MKLFGIFFALAIVLMLPFLFWGDHFQARFSVGGAAEWIESFGVWGWAAAITLLVLDIVLPVPATAVMSALGFLYGAVVGGLIGGIGSTLSGLTAYGFSRALGREAAERIAGKRDLERGEKLFSSAGGLMVAASRWLPLFPEVITCMAGLWSFAVFQ